MANNHATPMPQGVTLYRCINFASVSVSARSKFASSLPRKSSIPQFLRQCDKLVDLADRGIGVDHLQSQAASLTYSVDCLGDGVLKRPQLLRIPIHDTLP